MHINFNKVRQFLVFAAFIAFFAILFARLYYIQIIRHEHLSELARKQHKILTTLPHRRGNIYDRLNRVLAIHLDASSVYAVPKEITSKKGTARILAGRLGLDEEVLRQKLKKDNSFAWVKRKVSPEEAEKIKAVNLKGIYLREEPKRFYPGGNLACHLLGITGIDSQGLEGIELYYEQELKGEDGWRSSLRDARRREIISFQTDVLPARDGQSIVLTLDEVIQYIIEKETEGIVSAYRPDAVSIIAMDPATGEVLGMANYPSFDSNDLSGINPDFVKNRALADCFEPGSVFKVVTASAALEDGIVDFESEFFCENGAYKVGKRILHDHKPYGTLKFREIIEKSSNIGTVKVAKRLGKERLYHYISRFNFNATTGIDLPGEAPGIMRPPSQWSYVDMTTIPMGQGIAVTVLQLTSAFAAIANNGVIMRPYVVKKILNEKGTVVRENKPKALRRVVSKRTACQVKELLEGVIERGTGKRARMESFRACGKTGTAQKVNPEGGYYRKRYIASFVGFAPFEKPMVVLAICVDNPHGKYFGGQVGAPAFKSAMEKILSYMEAEGDRFPNRKNDIKKDT